MAQMKNLAYEMHLNGQCDPLECAWRPPHQGTPSSAPEVSGLSSADRPTASTVDDPSGGGGLTEPWRSTALAVANWLTRIANASTEESHDN